MIKFLILACATWALAASQAQQFDYYDYIDAPTNFQSQEPPPVAARPPPSRARAPQAPRTRAPPAPRPAAQPDPRLTDPHFDPNTTPVPILKDSRRIDTKTGAFVYEYAGADGSEKHEWRFSNGTVLGNYSFINDLGERETRVYSAGVFDPNHVDETTDPNYVDLGNYELYKHLEQPYVHIGPSGLEALSPRSRPQQPRAQSRPASRPAAPRPSRPPPPQFAVNEAPPPLDFNDAAALFEQRPSVSRVFDYEDLVAAPVAPAPPPPPRRTQPARGSSSRGRQGGAGRPRAPEQQESPRHRLDFTGQSPDAILDQFISRFQ